MQIDVFAAVRERVTAQSAAERYGMETRRGWCKCPFHAGGNERTASLKFYPNGSFHCYGCGVGGSSIDFVAQMFGITPLEAVKRLNSDFALGLDLNKPPDREAIRQHERTEEAYQQFEAWRTATVCALTDLCYTAHKGLQAVDDAGTLDVLTDEQTAALMWREWAEDTLDALQSGDMGSIMEIFRRRKEVEAICRRCQKTLSENTRTKLVAS